MDYKNGKIYTIRSYQTEDIYIGSTLQTLTKRLSKHKRSYKSWKNGKYHYVSSFELIKYDDVYIELIELFPCSSKMELNRREGQLIRSIDCVNKRIEGRTKQEYYQDTKEYHKKWVGEYYERNKDKIKEYNKELYENNRHKRIQQAKEWSEANKEKIAKRTQKKYDCECGGKYTHSNKLIHFKTQKHQAYVCLNE
jgi:hypothetical protein